MGSSWTGPGKRLQPDGNSTIALLRRLRPSVAMQGRVQNDASQPVGCGETRADVAPWHPNSSQYRPCSQPRRVKGSAQASRSQVTLPALLHSQPAISCCQGGRVDKAGSVGLAREKQDHQVMRTICLLFSFRVHPQIHQGPPGRKGRGLLSRWSPTQAPAEPSAGVQ